MDLVCPAALWIGIIVALQLDTVRVATDCDMNKVTYPKQPM